MKVITYLGFTVLSIFIQFCVMDFIQEKIQVQNSASANVSYRKKVVDDLFKNISSKPHALYYRTPTSSLKSMKRSSALSTISGKIYNNSSMSPVPLITTEGTTTIFDVLFVENSSTTEITTTEAFMTTTDFDNVTDVTYFEPANKSKTIPNAEPKISFSKYCGCNLLVCLYLLLL